MCTSKPKPSAQQIALMEAQTKQIEEQNRLIEEQRVIAEQQKIAADSDRKAQRDSQLSAEERRRSKSRVSSASFFTGPSTTNKPGIVGSLLRRGT